MDNLPPAISEALQPFRPKTQLEKDLEILRKREQANHQWRLDRAIQDQQQYLQSQGVLS